MLGAAELADADAILLDAEYTQAWRVFWRETPESRATRRMVWRERLQRRLCTICRPSGQNSLVGGRSGHGSR